MLRLRRAHFVVLLLLTGSVFSAALNAQPNPARTATLSNPLPNPYDRQFHTIELRVGSSSPAEIAVLIAQAYGLRDYVNDPASVQRLLRRVANDTRQNRLARDEALYRLARIDVHTDHLNAAAEKLAELGFVRKWRLAGPFAAGSDSAPPGLKQGISPKQRLTGDRERSPWRKPLASGPQAWQDLADFYPHAGAAVVFAATSVYSSHPQPVALRFSTDSAVTVFVNGRQVFDVSGGRGIGFDQHMVAVNLRAGWNPLVLRLAHQPDSPWRFGLRITGTEGGGISFPATTEPRHAEVVATGGSRTSPTSANDLVEMAKAAVANHPNSAMAIETLGLLEHEHARTGALDDLRAAAQLAPTAARWLEVADACGDSGCKFAALNAALASDPGNEPARLALANYYLARKQLEKARDLLRKAREREPGDFVVRNRLADLYVSVGLNAEALKASEQLEADFPHPLWLRRKLAARYLHFGLVDRARALLTVNLRADFDDAQQRSLLLRIYRRQRDTTSLRATYTDSLRLDPANVSALAELADLDAGDGNYASAGQRLRAALALAPDDDRLHERYANLLAREGHPHASQRVLARTLQLNPNLDNARRRLAFSADTPPSDTESAYLGDPAAVARAARQNPPSTGASAVKLADFRIERIDDNGLSSVREQQIYYLATEQAVRQFRTRTVQYAPDSQELRVLHARVYKRNGLVLEAEEDGDTGPSASSAAMYYDVRSRVIHYPALETGDVIELDYRISPLTSTNPYGDYFGELVVFRSALPAQLQNFALITPASRQFHIVQKRLAPAEITTKEDLRIYRWQVRDQAALPNDPKGPPTTEMAPYVHVSSFQTWDEVGRWYAQLIQPQLALDLALREQAARLAKNSGSELDRIRAIHQFVLRNTHYLAMEFGIYSYKPYPVSQVYARRFGDCKDKASLMIALLRQAGIEADIALLRTRRLGEIDPQATSVAPFNHAIVYIPKYDLWLDGTAEYAGPRELPLEDQGAMALTVSLDGHAKLRYVPVTHSGDNYTRRTVRARVLPNGRILFDGVTYTRGEEAPGLRREYETPERQREAVRNALAEVFPSVNVESVRVDGAHDLERPVTVEFRGALETYARRTMVPLPASWMPRSYVQQLAPLLSRSSDLLLAAPWTTEEELHFLLPPGASVQFLPADSTLETAFGTASLRYQRNGNELVVHTRVTFRKLRIPQSQYEPFRRFCQQVERAFQQEIKVGLQG